MSPFSRVLLSAACVFGTLTVVADPVGAAPIEERVPQLLADIEQNAIGLRSYEIVATPAAVYFAKETEVSDGVETSALWRYDRGTGSASIVFKDPSVAQITPQLGVGDTLYFTAWTEGTGTEPWLYDESTGSAQMLADANPGPDGSSPRDFVIGDLVYFVAIDEDHGEEIWSTKGTPGSTTLAVDVQPGPGWSQPRNLIMVPTGPTTAALFFTAISSDTGSELFRLDSGTKLTPIEVAPGLAGSNPQYLSLASDGALYFTAHEEGASDSGYRIAEPAANAGSDVVEELALGISTIEIATVGTAAYAVSGGFLTRSLWRIDDASAAPVEVVDSFRGRRFVDAGSGLMFQQSGDAGWELGISDGTSEGTVVDALVRSQVDVADVVPLGGGPGALFAATPIGESGAELWTTTGKAGTTAEVTQIRPGRFGADVDSIVAVDDRWFLFADDGIVGRQLWETDGTADGTRRLTTLGTDRGRGSNPRDFVEVGARSYFEVRQPDGNATLWFHDRTDGTVAALEPPAGSMWTSADNPTEFEGNVVFRARTDADGREPWVSDGTRAGTRRLADTSPGATSGSPRDFIAVDDSLVFVSANRLWIIRPGSSTSALTSGNWTPVAALGRTLIAWGCASDCGVHAIDIDTGTITMLANGGSVQGRATEFDGAVYFVTNSSSQLWRTDGTAPGTGIVDGFEEIAAGDIVAMDDQLVVQAALTSLDPTGLELELYVLDRAGVVRAVTIPTTDVQLLDLRDEQFVVVGDQLLTVGVRFGEDVGGPSDLKGGATPGTPLISIVGDRLTVVTEPVGQVITWIGDVGGDPYFLTVPAGSEDPKAALTSGEPGVTLWRTDGTAPGTTSIADFEDSGLTSFFQPTPIDGLLYGAGSTPSTGDEPFVFDLVPDPADPVDPGDPGPGDPTSTAPEIVSLDPARVFASRPIDETVDGRFEAGGRIPEGSMVEIDLAGRGGVAADGAKAVVMNVTAINPSGRGYLTVYPCGARPLASSLNYAAAGAVVGNEVVAKLSDDGTVCVFSAAETDLSVDVVGYVPASSGLVSLDPARVFGSRAIDETVDGRQQAGGRIAADSFVEVPITGRGGVDPTGAASVVMNITAVNPSGRGYITTYPCGDRPLASSLNYGAAGAVVGNELIAKLSPTGSVCVYTSAETDLTIDVVGYVPVTSPAVALDPARVYETRAMEQTIDRRQEQTGRVAAGGTVEIGIAGRAGVPTSGAGAVVMNITAVNPSGRGYVTMYPCGDRPLASSLNYGAAGVVVGNELVAKLSSDGTVCAFASAETDLTVDVVGYIPNA